MIPVLARRSALAVPLAIAVTLAIASSALAAPTWMDAITIRTADDIQLHDADFAGRDVAIAWDEPGSPRKVGIRTSVDAGSSFGPISWFGRSREPAVEVCPGSELNAVMGRRVGPGNWIVRHASGSVDGTGLLATAVAPTDGVQRWPDVACAGGRVFVSWYEREDGGHRLFVAHAPRGGGVFSAPIDLGLDDETFFFRSLAVAGAGDRAYAVFHRSDGDLRFKSWSVGAGPGFPVTAHPTQRIGGGRPNNPASYAVIDAAGDKVAVAWFRCNAIWARVSNDRGQTWGPARKLVEHAGCDGDFIAVQSSIAIQGDRIALTYHAAGFFSSEVRLIRTRSDFATFSDVQIAKRFQLEHLVGFLRAAGEWRLAAAFQREDRVRFRLDP